MSDAHAWNSGQRVSYWREQPLDVDAVIEGSSGSWAVEVRSGAVARSDLLGVAEFVRRGRDFRSLIVCDASHVAEASRSGVAAIEWRDHPLTGPATART